MPTSYMRVETTKILHVLPLHVMHMCNRSESRVSAVRGSPYLPPLPPPPVVCFTSIQWYAIELYCFGLHLVAHCFAVVGSGFLTVPNDRGWGCHGPWPRLPAARTSPALPCRFAAFLVGLHVRNSFRPKTVGEGPQNLPMPTRC